MQTIGVALGIFEMAPSLPVAPGRCLDLDRVIRFEWINHDHDQSPIAHNVESAETQAITYNRTARPGCTP